MERYLSRRGGSLFNLPRLGRRRRGELLDPAASRQSVLGDRGIAHLASSESWKNNESLGWGATVDIEGVGRVGGVIVADVLYEGVGRGNTLPSKELAADVPRTTRSKPRSRSTITSTSRRPTTTTAPGGATPSVPWTFLGVAGGLTILLLIGVLVFLRRLRTYSPPPSYVQVSDSPPPATAPSTGGGAPKLPHLAKEVTQARSSRPLGDT